MTVVVERPIGEGPGSGSDARPGAGSAAGPRIGAGAPSGRERRMQRWLWAAAAAGLVVLAALIGALAVPPTTKGDLEPTSAAPAGARAVVEILRRQGVTVSTTRRSREAVALAGADSTLVVAFPELLGPDQLTRLAGTPAKLVLVAPDLPAVEALAPFAQVAGVDPAATADPACDAPDAAAAGSARAGGSRYRLAAGAAEAAAVLCYPAAGGPAAAGAGDVGSVVFGRAAGREVVLLGQADVLRNAYLGAPNGTAALALRVLGARPTLVWYLPDPTELGTGAQPPTLGDLLPRWVAWVGLQLALVTLLVMLWRGRRLGRLVTEPLPVVVRAAETQEGRARLYRRAGAYRRASATLRTAALRRVARRLDVPVEQSADVVVRLAAQASGLPPAAVHDAFLGAPPTDDRGLVRLADALATVEAALAGGPAAATAGLDAGSDSPVARSRASRRAQPR